MQISTRQLFLTLLLFVPALSESETLVFPPYRHSYGIRKATPKHLFMFFGPRTSFDDPQGICTAKMTARDDPTTENDDDEVVVYGVNSGRHQLIYNTSMWSLSLFGKKGSGVGQFHSPKGVACDPHGNVYVVDQGNNRIVHLFNPKKKVEWKSAFDGRAGRFGKLKSPSQVGLDENGRVYVTDTGNRRIAVFDKSGTPAGVFPRVGDAYAFEEGPTTIAVADGSNEWSYFKRERVVFCADRSGKRLWRLGFDGTVEKTVTMPSGYAAGYGAIDYYHNFWVTDKNKHCVLKFDHNLRLLDIFGSYGEDDNQFVEPRGIAIWKRYGQTFVSEKAGAQYYWIGTELKKHTFTCKESVKRCVFALDLTEYSYVSLFYVASEDTVPVFGKKMMPPGGAEASFKNVDIDGWRNNLILRVEPTYSSYTYFWKYYKVKVTQ